jgi:hypothetical protein
MGQFDFSVSGGVLGKTESALSCLSVKEGE